MDFFTFIESISPLPTFILEITSTKTIKIFDSNYGIIVLFILLTINSFSLAFAFNMISPDLYSILHLPFTLTSK